MTQQQTCYDTKAADNFEFGVMAPVNSYRIGNPDSTMLYVSKWTDEEQGFWCYVEHDADGDYHTAVEKEDIDSALSS